MLPLLVSLALAALAGVAALLIRRRRHSAQAAAPPSAAAPPTPSNLRDDVRFTVYRPARVAPERWYKLLVYAHRAEGPAADGGWQEDLSARVQRTARAELGGDMPLYRTATEDAAAPVVRDSELLFVPEIDGFTFNPPHVALSWLEELHEAEFRMKAAGSLDGTTARGQLTILNGPLVVAQLALVVRVSTAEADAAAPPADDADDAVVERVAPYRRVFASYSRHDTDVVRRMREYGLALGDRYLIDVTDIRAGELWEPRIEELIREADVFQLFWSWNALRSEYVQREFRYALALGRPDFVRPVYWEEPLPAAHDRGLPPPELSAVHFQRVRLSSGRDTGSVPSVAPGEPPRQAGPPPPPARSATPPQAPPARGRGFGAGRLATAALVVLAIGAAGVVQLSSGDGASAGYGSGYGVAAPPEPPLAAPRPDDPAAAPVDVTGPVLVAPFTVAPPDETLDVFAVELQYAVAAAWELSAAELVVPGDDIGRLQALTGALVLVDATLGRAGDGIHIVPRVAALDGSGVRTASPIVLPDGVPPGDVVEQFVRSLEALLR